MTTTTESSENLIFSLISNNRQMYCTMLDFNSGIRSERKEDHISFSKPKTNETITIPYNEMKDFIIAALESYALFNPECKDKTIEITVKIKKITNK